MKIRNVFFFAIMCCLAGTINAQKVFDKPFQKWSRDEAQKILNESPWIRTYQSAEGTAALDREALLKEQDNVRITPGPRATDARAQAATMAMPVVMVRLHSGLVVREAYVRLRQIAANYDKMDDDKRAAFDASVKDLIDCPYCKNYYIVTMNKSTNSSRQTVDEGLFQTITPQQMKGNVWIVNDSGVRSPLAQFIPPKGGADQAVFFFPRKDGQGNELITAQSKSFKIEFSGDFFTSSNPYQKIIPRSFEFEVKRLLNGNDLIF